MINNQPNTLNEKGKIVDNILFFSRILRNAGIQVGPSQIINAVKAINFIGIKSRNDFYYVFKTCLINQKSNIFIFDQAFDIVFNKTKSISGINSDINSVEEKLNKEKNNEKNEISKRIGETLFPDNILSKKNTIISEDNIISNHKASYSQKERLNHLDFEAMDNSEILLAKIAISKLKIKSKKIKSRRYNSKKNGKYIDLKKTFQKTIRNGTSSIALSFKNNKLESPPIVVICDISGSMSNYSRMFLHFMHAIMDKKKRISTFLFGTRLSNITRYLKYYDIDIALNNVSENVVDWSGGTRIGECLKDYNKFWAKRVQTGNSVVLIITDGLDRGSNNILGAEMERLKKTCKKIIWLNPLMRYEKYQTLATGAATMQKYVDKMKKIHNLQSMLEITSELNEDI